MEDNRSECTQEEVNKERVGVGSTLELVAAAVSESADEQLAVAVSKSADKQLAATVTVVQPDSESLSCLGLFVGSSQVQIYDFG